MSSKLDSTSQQYEENQLIYGIDVGGTKIEIGIFSPELTLIDSWRTPTPINNYADFLQAILGLVNDAGQRYSKSKKIGFGVPGIINKKGQLKSANIPCASGRNIVKDLTELLECEISIGNDCRLFTLSECVAGAGDGYYSVYGAIIGTGAAGGFCIDSQLYNGSNGCAGEYGHLPVSAYLVDKYKLPIHQCGCGLKGCYESYVSGPGLGWLYNFFGSQTEDIQYFVENLNRDDSIARTTFDCYMNLLGASFASIVLSYDPDIIVVGGGISKLTKVVDSLPSYVNKHLFSGVQCPLIKVAKFGDSSGTRGAAILAKQQLDG